MHERRVAVATYNIHGCVGTDMRYRPERVAEVIRELDADIVGLQEVDCRVVPGRPSLRLEQLADATRYTALLGPCVRETRGEYGNALLSTLPVQDVRTLDLTVPGREPRGAMDADVEIDGEPLRVVVTHLGLRGVERLAQVARLLDALADPDGRPLVVLGDFNEWYPGSRVLRALEARLGRGGAFRTFPSFRPIFPLDRIWVVPGDVPVERRVHATPLARRASDHLPVRASLAWPTGRAGG